MKAVTYLRVSTEPKKQADGTMKGQSVEPQRLELAAFAASKNALIVAEFTDVISGKKFNRDGLDSMIAAAKRGEFDTILIVKLDRIGRSIRAVLELIEEFDKMGVAVIATSQGIDTSKDNPAGRLIMNVIAAVADFERSLICERTKAGLAVAKANGKILGKPSKLLPPVSERAAIVTQWQADCGDSDYRELARRLGGVSATTAWRVAKQLTAA